MYNVAFVYTKAAGSYEGVRTWTSFKSKEDFDAWWTKNPQIREREKVLEEGIGNARCIELTRETPQACRVAAAIQEATDPQTGKVSKYRLKMELLNNAFAEALETR